jgi:hypothetical protein
VSEQWVGRGPLGGVPARERSSRMTFTNRRHKQARMREVGTKRLREMLGAMQGFEHLVKQSIA